MKRLLLCTLASGMVLGCYARLESFDKRMAQLGCEYTQECHPTVFNDAYRDTDGCIRDVTRELDDAFDGCSYDATRGRACIRAFDRRNTNCDLIEMGPVPECKDVVTCTESSAIDTTLARRIIRGFVAPGPGAAGNVPLDEVLDLDAALDDALEDD